MRAWSTAVPPASVHIALTWFHIRRCPGADRLRRMARQRAQAADGPRSATLRPDHVRFAAVLAEAVPPVGAGVSPPGWPATAMVTVPLCEPVNHGPPGNTSSKVAVLDGSRTNWTPPFGPVRWTAT